MVYYDSDGKAMSSLQGEAFAHKGQEKHVEDLKMSDVKNTKPGDCFSMRCTINETFTTRSSCNVVVCPLLIHKMELSKFFFFY